MNRSLPFEPNSPKRLMPLPSLNDHGVLNPGFHDMTLSDVSELFGQFCGSERRIVLFKKLEELVAEAKSFEFAKHLVIDGSFVTSKEQPSDIDLIFAINGVEFPLPEATNPFVYNVLSSRKLRKKYGFDVLVAPVGSEAYDRYVEYFSRLKEGPSEVRKGLIRLELQP